MAQMSAPLSPHLPPHYLQVEDGVVIHVLGWDDFLDDEVHEGSLHLSQLLMFVMLDGNDYGVDALGDAGTILEGVFGSDLKQ